MRRNHCLLLAIQFAVRGSRCAVGTPATSLTHVQRGIPFREFTEYCSRCTQWTQKLSLFEEAIFAERNAPLPSATRFIAAVSRREVRNARRDTYFAPTAYITLFFVKILSENVEVSIASETRAFEKCARGYFHESIFGRSNGWRNYLARLISSALYFNRISISISDTHWGKKYLKNSKCLFVVI